jgi:RsiW-degrading membrane proteinase PrsW (M82 family)
MFYIPMIFIIIVSYIPSFAWLYFVLTQDIHPEKATDIAKAFILGSVVAVPVILFAVWGRELLDIASISLSPTISSFVYGAFIEEIMKGAFIYWFAISTSRWDEPIDTFIYAATLALGFAGIENLAFTLSFASDSFSDMQRLLILRSFTAVLIHIISSFLVTYGIVFWVKKNQIGRGLVLIGSGIAFHGLWNLAIEISRISGNGIILGMYFLICLPLFFGMILTIKHLKIISK